MRAQDIVVGEHYKIGSWNDRAIVQEVGNLRRSWNDKPIDGIRVRIHKVQRDGTEYGPSHSVLTIPNDAVVTLAQVKSTWADHEAAIAATAALLVRLKAEREQEKRRACALRDRFLELAGVEAKIDPYGSSFALGAGDMRTLIGLLEKAKGNG